MAHSLAEIVASLPEDEREEYIKDIDPVRLQYDWGF